MRPMREMTRLRSAVRLGDATDAPHSTRAGEAHGTGVCIYVPDNSKPGWRSEFLGDWS